MNKNMNEMDLPEIQPQDMEDCGDPAFKVLAEINRGRERMYITGNNYSGLMGPDETNSIDMLYACTNSSIFRIGPIELWSSSNPHYLDDASYEGFIEYLTTGTSSSKVDFFQ